MTLARLIDANYARQIRLPRGLDTRTPETVATASASLDKKFAAIRAWMAQQSMTRP